MTLFLVHEHVTIGQHTPLLEATIQKREIIILGDFRPHLQVYSYIVIELNLYHRVL